MTHCRHCRARFAAPPCGRKYYCSRRCQNRAAYLMFVSMFGMAPGTWYRRRDERIYGKQQQGAMR